MPVLHHLNILVHIVFGTLALLVGLGPICTAKGGAWHGRLGRWFLGLATGALVTAVLGLAVFNFRPFLAVIVLLSVYQAYSGYRGPAHPGRRANPARWGIFGRISGGWASVSAAAAAHCPGVVAGGDV